MNTDWIIKEKSEIYLKHAFAGLMPPIKYVMYSTVLDRIVAVDRLDLWSFYEAAQLLSSKIALSVCILREDISHLNINEGNCHEWTLTNKKELLPKKQTPNMVSVLTRDELQHMGLPRDYENEMEVLEKDLSFIRFVVKATYSFRLAHYFIGAHPKSINDFQQYYLSLFSDAVDGSVLKAQKDKTLWSEGLAGEIRKILYRSDTTREALTKVTEMYNEKPIFNLETPEGIAYKKKMGRALFYRRTYLDKFSLFLEWKIPNARS